MKWKILGTSLLLGILLVGCVSKRVHEELMQERDGLDAQYRQLSQENENVIAEKGDLEKQLAKVRSQLSDTDKRLQEKTKELKDLEETLTKKDTEAEKLASLVERKNDQLRRASDELTAISDELALKRSALDEAEAKILEAQEKASETHKLYDSLVNDLNSELADNKIKIEEMKDGIKLNLSQDILFDSGSARLSSGGEAVIKKVSDRLKDNNYETWVAGYTDNIPITGGLANRYPTNWELAGARASSVVRLLESSGVASDRLSAVSFGENNPVEANDTAEGRAKNRRIEIRLRPQE